MSSQDLCPTYPCTAARSSEPVIGVAIASLLVLLGAIALVTWAGEAKVSQEAPPPACLARGPVTSDQIDAAVVRVRAADAAATRTAQNGSPYAAAKIGLPASGPEHDQAVKAATALAAARDSLAQLCAVARA